MWKIRAEIAAIVIGFFTAVGPAWAVNSTWLGGVGNWNDATQWDANPSFPNGVSDNATITSGNATLNLHVRLNQFTMSGGTLDGGFNLTNLSLTAWTGGTMAGTGQTLANGGIAIDAGGGVALDTRILRTVSSSSLTNGRLYGYNGALLTNVSGATFSIQDDSSFVYGGGAQSSIANAGTFVKSGAGNAVSGFDIGLSAIGWLFTNTGTAVANAGSLEFSGGGYSSGTITVAPPARVIFNFNNFTVVGPVRGPGMVNIGGGGAQVEFRGPYQVGSTLIEGSTAYFNSSSATSAVLNLVGGTLSGASNLIITGSSTWTGGGMTDTGQTLANGGIAIDANFSSVSIQQRTLRTSGSSSLTNGYLYGGSAAVISNVAGATFSIQDDSSIYYGLGGDPPVFQNAGTLVKSGAGNNVSGFGAGISIVTFALTNSGTVRVNKGTLSFGGGYVQTAGSTILTGGVINSSTTMELSGGSLLGTGTVNATVSNSGTIAPGFPTGTLTFNGDVTQQIGSRLHLEIAGYTAGQRDFVVVNGTPTFGGSLLVSLINNFASVATNGSRFTMLTSTAPIAGSFANVAHGGTLLTTEGYASFVVQYSGSSLVLSNMTIVDTDGDGMPNWWEDAYGFDKGNSADGALDFDGDGLSNAAEFAAGTDPTSATSTLRITAVSRETNNVRVTWTTIGGKKYRLQAGPGTGNGSFVTNNLVDIGSLVTMPGSGVSFTNQVDVGGATNVPARYYRIRLVP